MPVEPMASSPGVRARMQKQRTRDTGPELALRRALHARGLRYRIQVELLPRRRADIVFPSARVVVDVRGDWWHGCPEHASRARANGAWWDMKIARNIARDLDTEQRLLNLGWTTIVVWECEGTACAATRIEAAVRGRRQLAGAKAGG